MKQINCLNVNKLKIASRIVALKPLLMEKMKNKRLAFAKMCVDWTRRTGAS
jgi:hypothetical protein